MQHDSALELGSSPFFLFWVLLLGRRTFLIGIHQHVFLLKSELARTKFGLLDFDATVDLANLCITLWKTLRALYLWMPAKLMISILSTDEKSVLWSPSKTSLVRAIMSLTCM